MQSDASSSSSPNKPLQLSRLSPSEPVRRVRRAGSDKATAPVVPQQVYVLSADGSSLFLLDPTRPLIDEEPPPYVSLSADITNQELRDVDNGHGTGRPLTSRDFDGYEPFPREVREASSAPALPDTQTLHVRPSTMPSLAIPTSHQTSLSPSHSEIGTSTEWPTSSSNESSNPISTVLTDERTPLLGDGRSAALEDASRPRLRGFWRSVSCGDLEEGESTTWRAGWKRFWSPVGRGEYWKAMAHLWFLNLPFALIVWPPLLVGTLVGTALLITLPIGAAIWWLTLFISRSAARLELAMQIYYHSPLSTHLLPSTHHPIFYRVKERSTPSSPITSRSEAPVELHWEKRFIRCSYTMFCDQYSYSALSYFLLIKPLIVLLSTIALLALFPIATVLIFPLPVYMRAARRWGRWQAGIAMENL